MQKDVSIILFDGWCNLCNSSVQFIIRFDKKKKFKFASLQSDQAKKLLNEYKYDSASPESIVLIENGRVYFQSTAALKIAKELGFPIFLLYAFMLIPAFIRNGIYRWIAKNRYKWFGKRNACTLSDNTADRFL